MKVSNLNYARKFSSYFVSLIEVTGSSGSGPLVTGPRDKLEEVVGLPPLPITSNKVDDGCVTDFDAADLETITYDRCTVGSNDPTVAASEQAESNFGVNDDIESQAPTVDSCAAANLPAGARHKQNVLAVKISVDEKEEATSAGATTPTVVPEGIRYFFTSTMMSLVGISLLAFSLTLTIWNFWRAFTYVFSPLATSILLRCGLNMALCAFAILMVVFANKNWFGSWGRGIRVLGNVLGGIGMWELIESLVSYMTHEDPAKDLIIYAVWLAICSIVVYVVYKWRNINIIDTSLLSPV